MPIDQRTRTDVGLVRPTIDELTTNVLPSALEALGADPRIAGLGCLVIEVDARCWTLVASGERATLRHGGVDAATRASHLRVSEQQLVDLALDQLTPVGLMTSGSLDLQRGSLGHVLDWWLVLRAALDGGFGPQASDIDLPDDLGRSFVLDDDPDEIRTFLEQAGFVHLRGVFTTEEMAAVSADMDRAAPSYAPGDGRSWWARTAEGDQLVRMQGFDRHAPSVATLLTDHRFARLGAIPGLGHVHEGLEGNRIEALFKPIGVVEGISDVPWHKDCSLGRHSYECCSLTTGISVTGAGPGSGQLRVIAGSHRIRCWPSLLDVTTLGLPEVALATETGDVTVHLSCTLHMAEPPTERGRRVMYTGFRLPRPDGDASAEAFHRLMREARESAPLTTSQSSAR